MFLAGMMGSHSITRIPGDNFSRVDSTAKYLNEKIANAPFTRIGNSLAYMSHPLPLPEARMRLTKTIAIRNWLFESAFGPIQAHLTYLEIGNVIFVSTPCDYSGEIWVNGHIQVPPGHQVIITSFNGDYVGYITEDSHYDTRSHAEVRTMNWVGPGFGHYSSSVISRALEKISH
jgi:hypothetical protein